MNPDPYRGFFGADANSYAKDVQDHIDYGTSGNVAGFIAETIQVCINIIYHVQYLRWSLNWPTFLFKFFTMAYSRGLKE
jgi:bacteriorhodopsin